MATLSQRQGVGKGVAQHWKTMSRFFGGVSQKKVGKLFKSLDTDSSGDLSWDEFCGAIEGVDAEAALARAMATADGFEKLKTLFASTRMATGPSPPRNGAPR